MTSIGDREGRRRLADHDRGGEKYDQWAGRGGPGLTRQATGEPVKERVGVSYACWMLALALACHRAWGMARAWGVGMGGSSPYSKDRSGEEERGGRLVLVPPPIGETHINFVEYQGMKDEG